MKHWIINGDLYRAGELHTAVYQAAQRFEKEGPIVIEERGKFTWRRINLKEYEKLKRKK